MPWEKAGDSGRGHQTLWGCSNKAPLCCRLNAEFWHWGAARAGEQHPPLWWDRVPGSILPTLLSKQIYWGVLFTLSVSFWGQLHFSLHSALCCVQLCLPSASRVGERGQLMVFHYIVIPSSPKSRDFSLPGCRSYYSTPKGWYSFGSTHCIPRGSCSHQIMQPPDQLSPIESCKMALSRLGLSLQIEVVFKINSHLLRLFLGLQLKIILGLEVLNHFSAFFHPFPPLFYKRKVAEARVHSEIRLGLPIVSFLECKFWVSNFCYFLGFRFMPPPKKKNNPTNQTGR